MFERQKEQYVSLLQTELVGAKVEIESGIKRSVHKELGKVNREVESVQDSFQKLITHMRETQDYSERRIEDNLKAMQTQIDKIAE